MRVLFISRKYPPAVGGMERLSYKLISLMKGRVQAATITWGGSQAALPFFMAYALFRALLVASRGVDLVHLSDAVLAPIGVILKALFRVPVVVTVHGLDVIFPPQLYQWIMPWLLRRMDRIACNSQSTYNACIERGMTAKQCLIIHPGVSIPDSVPSRDDARRWLETRISQNLDNAIVLLTAGRLVPRKGVAWFIESVLPQLLSADSGTFYIVVGAGPDEDRILRTVESLNLEGIVHLLGRVSETDLARAYAAADLFIMPNIRRPGDMEGFGLVALEAGAHALPVLASDLEGIRDAIVVGQTGELIPSAEARQWVETLTEYSAKPDKLRALAASAQTTVRQRFTWTRMVDQYEVLFREIVHQADRHGGPSAETHHCSDEPARE